MSGRGRAWASGLARTVAAASMFVAAFVVPVAVAEHQYVVEPGDTLVALARRYDTDVSTLRDLNGIVGDLLRVGDVLELPRPHRRGFTNVFATDHDTLASLAAAHDLRAETLAQANPEIPPGASLAGRLVLVPPADGRTVRAAFGDTLASLAARYGDDPGALAERSGLAAGATLIPGQPLLFVVLPVGEVGGRPVESPGTGAGATSPGASVAGTEAHAEVHGGAGAEAGDAAGTSALLGAPASGGPHDTVTRQIALLRDLPQLLAEVDAAPQSFATPLPLASAGRVTSSYGWRAISVAGNHFHHGLDFGAPSGTPVLAALNGVVRVAGWSGSYGYAVYLDHGDGLQTRYAHLSRILVRPGARVVRGDRIGSVGSTGASTGPHLHFEVRLDGRSMDPRLVLPTVQSAAR